MQPRICFLASQLHAVDSILAGIAAYSKKYGPWCLEVLPSADSAILTTLKRAGYAGIISHIHAGKVATGLRTLDCPLVNIAGDSLGEPFACVRLDDLAVGEMGARHLMDLGYRRFGFFGLDMSFSRDRFAGFTRALKTRRFDCIANYADQQQQSWHGWDACQQHQRVRDFLARLETPSAVMACSDFMGRLLIAVCDAMHLRVPEDIAILGVDNDLGKCESDVVTLSSIDVDRPRLGYEAAAILDRLMHGQSPPPRPVTVSPRTLVQRRSTGQLTFTDPEVSAAMRYIHDNACEGISVDAVCRHSSISRRQLERRFSAAVGRSPGDEIRRLRLDRARHLVLSTPLPMTDISAQCGFEYLSHFSTAFRQAFGTPPRKYRQDHAEH